MNKYLTSVNIYAKLCSNKISDFKKKGPIGELK